MHKSNLERSTELDGLRGLAAVAVVFYHSILYPGNNASTVLLEPVQSLSSWRDVITKIALTILNGHSAVLLFFILSGFVLTLSLDKMRGSPGGVVAKFTVRRLCRLYPALIACLLLMWGLSLIYRNIGAVGMPFVTTETFLRNAVLVQNVLLGPTHTIQVEVLVIPFLLAMFAARAMLGTWGVIAGVAYSLLAMDRPWMVMQLPYIGDWLIAFAAGMLIASPIVRRIASRIDGFGIAVLAVGFVFCRLFSPLVDHGAVIVQVAVSSALVASLYYSRADSVVRAILVTRPVQFLGKISYSLYLLNVLALLMIWSVVGQTAVYQERPLEIGLLIGLAATLASIPASIMFERWFEQGGVRLGRYLTRQRKPAGMSSEAIGAPAE
ncbi:acyltransferase [Mesorhizobium sp. BR1-1-9]|uniref:acyltransferase family protein n=1 Tax=Mesorhizobium sp. BR1-1-9 TaxID=2876646 RepID=UPI001CD0D7DE|nr:acyltransferase [Mesorhizobium sp. BR1-1-9]MBZ9873068.1 acyltransferase [Mesorhizobium sp. BR1-1-9]